MQHRLSSLKESESRQTVWAGYCEGRRIEVSKVWVAEEEQYELKSGCAI